MGDALHARLVAREALGRAVLEELREPAPLIGIESCAAARTANASASIRRTILPGMPGAARGRRSSGQMPPALAKLVSSAGPCCRSTTVTS
jgi:hypothetical protein